MAKPVPPIPKILGEINNALPMYKLTYKARGCSRKFEKVWGKWIEKISGEVMV